MESGTHAPDTLGSNWLLAFLKLTENRHAITWPFGLASGRRRAERFAPAAELAWAVHHHTEPRAASQRSRISEEGGANESVRTPVPFTASLRRGYPGDPVRFKSSTKDSVHAHSQIDIKTDLKTAFRHPQAPAQ